MYRLSVELLIAASLSASAANACAMIPPEAPPLTCTVTGAKLLPAGSGGEAALCEEVRRATLPSAPQGTAIEISVDTPFQLSAVTILPNGRSLPRVTTSVSDRDLSARSFRRLADALAQQLNSVRP